MNRSFRLAVLTLIPLVAGCSESDGLEDLGNSTTQDDDAGASGGDDEIAMPGDDDVVPAADDRADDEVAGNDDGMDDVTFGPGAPAVEVAEPEPVPEPEPEGEGPNEDDPLVACPNAVAFGDDPMIDDFEDLSDASLSVDNRAGSWYSYNDATAGTMQLLEWIEVNDAASGTGGVLHVQGSGFPEYSGIGVGLRWTETGAEFCYYDASYYDGISFWARGNSSMRVALQTPAVRPLSEGGRCSDTSSCYDSHGMDITMSSDWTRYRIGFGAVEQAGWGTPAGEFLPSELFTIEFQFPQGVGYDIQLDDLAFFQEGDDVTEPEPVAMPDAGVVLEPSPEPFLDAGVEASDAGAP